MSLTEKEIDGLDPEDLMTALDLLDDNDVSAEGVETVDDAKRRLRRSLATSRQSSVAVDETIKIRKVSGNYLVISDYLFSCI